MSATTVGTLSSAMANVTALLTRMAAMADERGYYVAVTSPGWDAGGWDALTMSGSLHKMMAEAIKEMVTQWTVARGGPRVRPPLQVWLRITDVADGKLRVGPASTIGVRIPTVHRYREVCAAFELIAGGKNTPSGRLLDYQPGSAFNTYSGVGRDAVRAVLAILDMPQHRTILRKG